MTRTFSRETRVDVPADALFAWHARPGALDRLTPPWERFTVVSQDGGIRDGDRLVARVGVLGDLGPRWVARHEGYEAGRQFRDVQESGPFAEWAHTHRMEPVAGDASAATLTDRIELRFPLDALIDPLFGGLVERKLERMFRYRHAVTRGDVPRHHAVAREGPLTIAVTGATGLVGSALVPYLRLGGHRVWCVTRSRAKAEGDGMVFWDPARGEIDAAALQGVDAVVHLAGENVAGRWTEAKKARIRDSRVDGTGLLARTLAGLTDKPRVLVSASGINFYGDTGDRAVDEDASSGDGFLASVCREWEAATAPAREAGVRVVMPRIGVVLDARGGALEKMLPPFLWGLGGRLGPGEAYMSFLGLDDLLDVIHQAIFDDGLEGPVNACAPEPVTGRELAATLGRVLRRPALLPVPATALRALLGRQAAEEMLLGGPRARPARLEARGFRFRTPGLEATLRHALGR